MVETSRCEFIANLPVKLLMQWFGRSAIQSDHFKSENRMAPPFFCDRCAIREFHFVDCVGQRDSSRKLLAAASLRQSGLAISMKLVCCPTTTWSELSFKCRLKLRAPI